MSLRDVIEETMRRGRVLVGLDFDGTIAPIVDRPALAVPNRDAMERLTTLAHMPGVRVVVVSGRALADLRARIGEPPGITLIGEHGNDVGDERPRPPVLLEAIRLVETLGETTPGSMVEVKGQSVAFHTRLAGEPSGREATDSLRAWASEREGIHLLEGRDVLELSAATRTKGDAMLELGEGADVIVFFGDDRTDETVFERLGPEDVGVKVGDGETAARHRVGDLAGVVDLLDAMVSARRMAS